VFYSIFSKHKKFPLSLPFFVFEETLSMQKHQADKISESLSAELPH